MYAFTTKLLRPACGVALSFGLAGCLNLTPSPFQETGPVIGNLLARLTGGTVKTYVAVGSSDTLYSSTDGTNFTSGTVAGDTTIDLHAVTWTGTNYVVVGGTNTLEANFPNIYYSSDLKTWTAATGVPACKSGTGDPIFYSVASNGSGTVVAGGKTNVSGPCVAYSTDHGKTWAAATVPGTASRIARVAFDGNNFVIANNGVCSSSAYVFTSSDGATFATPAGGIPFASKTIGTVGELARLGSTSTLVIALESDSFTANVTSCYTSNSAASWTCDSPGNYIFGNNASNQKPLAIAASSARVVALGELNGTQCRYDFSDSVSTPTFQSTATFMTGCTSITWKDAAHDGSQFLAVGANSSNAGQVGVSSTGAAGDWTITTLGTKSLNGLLIK